MELGDRNFVDREFGDMDLVIVTLVTGSCVTWPW